MSEELNEIKRRVRRDFVAGPNNGARALPYLEQFFDANRDLMAHNVTGVAEIISRTSSISNLSLTRR